MQKKPCQAAWQVKHLAMCVAVLGRPVDSLAFELCLLWMKKRARLLCGSEVRRDITSTKASNRWWPARLPRCQCLASCHTGATVLIHHFGQRYVQEWHRHRVKQHIICHCHITPRVVILQRWQMQEDGEWEQHPVLRKVWGGAGAQVHLVPSVSPVRGLAVQE